MFDLTISEDTTSVISSPESASGRMPFGSPAGLMTDLFGPVPVRANLSARQAKDLGLMMSGTFGPLGHGSSASADLQSFLESRLQAKTSNLGSTLFKLTWKQWVTPSGVSRSRLRASVLRTSATERTSWPTPTACEAGGTPEQFIARTLKSIAKGSKMGASLTDLGLVAQLASWPTPMAGTPAQKGYNAAGNTDSSRKTVELSISNQPARLTVFGVMLTGCCAETRSGGQLNPAHSRWLMGLPPEWDACAPTATRLTQKPHARSSKRLTK
jgi:hypothetical protein